MYSGVKYKIKMIFPLATLTSEIVWKLKIKLSCPGCIGIFVLCVL